MPTTSRILWLDDDGPNRFPYELSVLADKGLSSDWAEDATEAVRKLSTVVFSLVLLDQVFPLVKGSTYKDIWSGCRLLYWLRGLEPPPGAPQGAIWAKLLKQTN